MGDLLGSPRVAPVIFVSRPHGAASRAVPPAIRRFEPLFRCEMPSLAPNFTCMCPLGWIQAENVHLHLNAGGGSGTKPEGGEMGPITPALTARIPLDPRSKGCLVESGTGVGDPEGSALVGPLMIFPRPPQRLFARAAEGERRVKNDVKGRRSGCDHTSTNAPDPIRTPQSSVLGRE
ncbi:hypothetical protein Ancab_025140 [Ancistrocladus abbreviatus]